jgi:hypothetical protein
VPLGRKLKVSPSVFQHRDHVNVCMDVTILTLYAPQHK